MALTGLHTNWQYGSYEQDLIRFLNQAENSSGNYTRPYYDGSIAIGYGFDLVQHNADEITAYLNRVNDALGLQGAQRITLTQNDITLLNEARTATAARRQEIYQQLDLTFPSQNYATTLRDIVLSDYETALNTALGSASELLQSKERIAVISLLYNMSGSTSAAIRSAIPKTIAAIQHDNRAEAWYEIRYGSNKNGIHASRRYKEAELFGLYDTGAMTTDEAKEVMRMYTKHQSTILDYESTHTPPATIELEIGTAAIYLNMNFAQGTNINGEIIVGKGLDSYSYTPDEKNNPNDTILLGTAQNDLIFGEAGDDGIVGMDGNDVIYGGEGNDQIIGGKGNDILEGGSGNDDYIFQSGDGSDKINDSEGTNRILWEDNNGNLHVEKTFYKTADAQWKSADGTTEVNQNSPYKMVFQDGTTVELGDSINSFDINLKDVPANPILLVV